nr:MAG TPA: zinc-ribbon containing domain protein [Caudoviricetes sp.]
MFFFLLALALCFVAGAVAQSRGRSLIGWLILSAVAGLLVSVVNAAAGVATPALLAILALVLPKVGNAAFGKDAAGAAITPDTHVKCPDCRGYVPKDASKCQHCATPLVPQT